MRGPARLCVLVVDDDDDIRFLTKLALESGADWTVLTASGGREAVDVARERRPDALLLDLMMPDLDGLMTIEQLRAHATTRDIPVILFTAKAVIGTRQPWDDVGVAGVISKPYDPMTLAGRVAQMLHWQAPARRAARAADPV